MTILERVGELAIGEIVAKRVAAKITQIEELKTARKTFKRGSQERIATNEL